MTEQIHQEGRHLPLAKQSAGLLMFRRLTCQVQVFLVHPGGPFWARKDKGAWSIPKGEHTASEPPIEAALREFTEETGFQPRSPYFELGSICQAGGKLVTAWAFEGDCDPAKLVSNIVRIEWPPRSGIQVEFPEVDRAGWFSRPDALEHILASQRSFLDRFAAACEDRTHPS